MQADYAPLFDMEEARRQAYEQGSSEGYHDGIIEGRRRQRTNVPEEPWEELGRVKAEADSQAQVRKGSKK